MALPGGLRLLIDECDAAMVAVGFDGHKEPWDAFRGRRYATLRNPDGTGVDLFDAIAG